MGAVSAIMNTRPINDAVVKHWKEKAGDRQTVAFCSTVAHAEAVAASFNGSGVPTVIVHGEMSDVERNAVLAEYTEGRAQVIVNVAVLTEGWDHPPTSCVILLRPSSYKSTMIQMIGRGLRTIDPAEYPDLVKKDCVVLDFGTSTLLHGSLEQDVNLDDQMGEGEAPTKECPEYLFTAGYDVFARIIKADDLRLQSGFLLTNPNTVVVNEARESFAQHRRRHLRQLRHIEPTLVNHAPHSWSVLWVKAWRFGNGDFVTRNDLGSYAVGSCWISDCRISMDGHAVSYSELKSVTINECEAVAFWIVDDDLVRWATPEHRFITLVFWSLDSDFWLKKPGAILVVVEFQLPVHEKQGDENLAAELLNLLDDVRACSRATSSSVRQISTKAA